MISKLKHCCVIAMVASLLTAGSALGQGISFSTVALTGDPAPGTDPNVVYSGFSPPVLNGAGQTAFIGSLTGPGVDLTNDRGIWSEGGGSLSLIAREGDSAPGTDPNVVYSGFSPPVLNGAGQTAFIGSLTGTGVVFANETGIWSEGSGSLSLIARDGDAAPGAGPGVAFDGLGGNRGDLSFNEAGQTAFTGLLTGPGIDLSNNNGIWLGGTGSLALIARTGDPAPDTEPGVVYTDISPNSDAPLNAAGQTAFLGGTTTVFGIWSGGSGSLGLVVRGGDPAPGTGRAWCTAP